MNDAPSTFPQSSPQVGTFYGRLSKEFPSQIIIDTTEVCNLGCVHCPHPDFKKSQYYEGRFLDPELNKKLVDEVADSGKGITEYLRYTGNGEPFAHKKIFEMLGYASKHSGTSVCLTTNGTLLDEKRVEKLLECNLHLVDISIDAFTPETYAKVRVNGDLAVTQANVQRLIERTRESGSQMKVVVSYIDQPLNHHETADFEAYWKDFGASYVVVRRLHSAAGQNHDIKVQIGERVKNQDRRPCLYPWERIVLSPAGSLAYCPEDWVHGSEIIDYRTTTVKETWSGPYYSKLREAHCSNDFSGHKFCGQCPDWSLTRWPDEGRSYSDMVKELKKTA